MLYCPNCQSLQESDAQVCAVCQESVLREPAPKDMVKLAETLPLPDGERLGQALSDAGIFFECKDAGDLMGSTVFVPYESWQRACDLVSKLGLDAQDTSGLPQPDGEEEEPSRKKLISRIVLFACFIGLVWAVVALSDTVIAFVKGLFAAG